MVSRPMQAPVSDQAFNWSEWTASGPGFTVGFRVLDIDSHGDATVNPVP